MRIPFDSLCLNAIVHELKPFENAKVQKVVQPDPNTIVLGMFGPGEAHLLISCDPVFARTHFVTKRYKNPQPLHGFCTQLRSHIEGSYVTEVRQIGFDRILEIDFHSANGPRRLVVELMGKHSNIMLLGSDLKIIAAAKTVGAGKSHRLVMPGRMYEKPPFEPKPPIWKAKPGDDLKQYEGASPFLASLVEGGTLSTAEIGNLVKRGGYKPSLVRGAGAYPIALPDSSANESLSIALELHFDQAVQDHRFTQLSQSLLAQLNRVLVAREAAIHDLEQAADAAKRAGKLQMQGELILAYGYSLEEGADKLDAFDYEGNPVSIPLKKDMTFKENANWLFEKAKKAKHAASTVKDQLVRIKVDRDAIESLIVQIDDVKTLEELEQLHEQAKQKRWLHVQTAPTRTKEERPYQGHKIRELLGPGGWRVLYGENSTANDYLTTKVAKPNDLWFHVRSATSTHVVIPTANHPEKVSREAMLFAAKTAALNSISKHSSLVPVDYTLKKYVRKPRGSAVGFVIYDHEKTIDVDCSKT